MVPSAKNCGDCSRPTSPTSYEVLAGPEYGVQPPGESAERRVEPFQPHGCRKIPSPVTASLFVCLTVSRPIHCQPLIRASPLFGEIKRRLSPLTLL